MANGVIKGQGTHLYFVDSSGSTAELIKLACPTGLTGMTAGAKERIETTDLDELEDKQYVSGLGDPSTISVPFNFVPTAPSHQALISELKDSGANLNWLVCLSDGVAAPTLEVNDEIKPPVGRTSAAFVAYVADVDLSVSTSEIVRGTLTLQRSGKVKWNWKV
ncbi:phage tail tube protein [Alcaligenes endophyticus]|uniref:Phage tail protein n=1 Tax=Alcaligenes endophyticus TaxID=1929088 RepID=A0ABT8ENE7_9BURK|nr:phage tail tube protein [Alcaligenes endophyticus]MCX5592797.1 hypothetical protein [Alcaligenes endophyticus]MDN4122839.1 hypothetical protein [Alcaligenes endophyticus]